MCEKIPFTCKHSSRCFYFQVAAPADDTYLTYHPLKDDLSSQVSSDCSLMTPADFMVGPSNCVLPKNYSNYAKRIRDLEVREDDVWVVSFPKCGKYCTFIFKILLF